MCGVPRENITVQHGHDAMSRLMSFESPSFDPSLTSEEDGRSEEGLDRRRRFVRGRAVGKKLSRLARRALILCESKA